jgi:hypothetical protein
VEGREAFEPPSFFQTNGMEKDGIEPPTPAFSGPRAYHCASLAERDLQVD